MLAKEFTLRDDFPAVAYDSWRLLAEADLEGAPFERDARPLGAVQTGFDLRQEHAHPDLTVTNQAILDDLQGGVTSLLLRLDSAARNGLDPDDPAADGFVGRDGLMVYHRDDLDTALA